jgi:phospholipase/carboxylesterase
MTLEKIVKQTGENPKIVIIWMHGLGADGNDFAPVVPQFNIPGLPVKFIFPHAPQIPVTINGGMVMRAWYDITMMDIGKHADKKGVLDSAVLIKALIQEQINQGFAYEQIILAGFSQGSAMALHLATTLSDKLAGVIALSGYLPIPEALSQKVNLSIPFFMGHGTQDPVVPFSLGQRSKERLEAFGYTVNWNSYPIQHGVSMDEINDIKQWLVKTFV